MKTTIITLFLSLVVLTSCEKPVYGCMDKTATNYKSSATEDDNSCTYNGTIVFWQNADNGSIGVSVAGAQSAVISKYYPNSTSVSCGSSGCVTFTLAAGQHHYSAVSNTKEWEGYVTVTANKCNQILLK